MAEGNGQATQNTSGQEQTSVDQAIADGEGREGQGKQTQIGFDPSWWDSFLWGLERDMHVPAKSLPVTSRVQDAGLNELLSYLSQTLSGFEPGIGAFTPELPGSTSIQNASLLGLERIASGESGVFQDTGSAAGLQAIQDILGRGPEHFTDFFEEGIAAPAERDLERALEQNAARAVGSGNLFGSDRAKADQMTTRDFFTNMSEQRARYGLQTLGQDTQDSLAALGLLPSVAQLDLDTNLGVAERLFGIGAQERAQGVEQVEFNREEADRQQQAIFDILDLLLRGGTAPTFGIAGGFDLGSPSPSQGGLISGVMGALG